MRIYPQHGVWEERLMPKDQSFEDAVVFLAASAFFSWIGNAEGAKKERPALIFGQSFLERGHRLSTFADLVEDFAVSNSVHVPGVSEVGRSLRVHRRLGAVTLAVFAVALRALVHVNPPGSLHSGFRGQERILEFLDFLRYDPRLVLLENGVNECDANNGEKRGEKDFARLELALRVGGHGGQENSRTTEWTTKANPAAVVACCAPTKNGR